jgi:hypothetical protein
MGRGNSSEAPTEGALAGSRIRALGKPFARIHVFAGRPEWSSLKFILYWTGTHSPRNRESWDEEPRNERLLGPSNLGMEFARIGF